MRDQFTHLAYWMVLICLGTIYLMPWFAQVPFFILLGVKGDRWMVSFRLNELSRVNKGLCAQ
jgi:hypothetical protein